MAASQPHPVRKVFSATEIVTVSSVPQKSSFGAWQTQLSSRFGPLRARIKQIERPEFGSTWKATLQIRPLALESSQWYESKGLVGIASAELLERVSEPNWLQRSVTSIRLWALSQQTNYPLTASLCFNNREGLTSEFQEQLMQTGTYHLLSVSGLHIVLLANALFALFGFLPVSRGYQLLLVWCFLSLYAVATGMEVPAMRAVLMWIILSSAYLLRRNADGLSALALAAVGLLLWNPTWIHDVSFHLSFLTTGFLALNANRERSEHELELQSSISFAVTAWLSSIPYSLVRFGSFSWIAVPANLLILPLADLIIILGFLNALASFSGIGLLEMVFGWLVDIASISLEAIIATFASVPGASYIGPSMHTWLAVCCYLIGFYVLARRLPYQKS